VDAVAQAFRNLVIDLGAEPGQAAEGRLDMPAGATEAVVKIEMPEGGIEIVHPHQANDAATEPDAFGVSGRAVNGLGGFHELVGLALAVLGGLCGGRFTLLVLGVIVSALGQGASKSKQKDSSGNSKMP